MQGVEGDPGHHEGTDMDIFTPDYLRGFLIGLFIVVMTALIVRVASRDAKARKAAKESKVEQATTDAHD
jgi:hypothetical protein